MAEHRKTYNLSGGEPPKVKIHNWVEERALYDAQHSQQGKTRTACPTMHLHAQDLQLGVDYQTSNSDYGSVSARAHPIIRPPMELSDIRAQRLKMEREYDTKIVDQSKSHQIMHMEDDPDRFMSTTQQFHSRPAIAPRPALPVPEEPVTIYSVGHLQYNRTSKAGVGRSDGFSRPISVYDKGAEKE
eukprot:gnl/Dysnectes_brevis/574_a633_4046.p1 GENE.gnl/Dysnectes_brevis/574_a633_4046~~gnl/Dysnectes_brevis/574_a633_4046.p1  ORF type:complete len:186 (+),score=31.27 gnl/Dysnectes_brevis/574_a633_4046:27-584(+)